MIEKHLVRFFSTVVASTALVVAATPLHAAVIAHWSFDTPTITTDANGIASAADQTGNHNATTVLNGTGVTIQSVAGQFGQAADYNNGIGAQGTNNASMSVPQLTEIAGASAGDFTVSAWAKVPDNGATAWDDNPILADWGNAAANTNR